MKPFTLATDRALCQFGEQVVLQMLVYLFASVFEDQLYVDIIPNVCGGALQYLEPYG